MNLKLIRIIIICFFSLFFSSLSARITIKNEYQAEIGINGGGSSYIGDANYMIFDNMQLAGSGFVRYKFNPRLAVRAEAGIANIAGQGFKNTLYLVDFCGEFNFFDLEDNPYKRFSKTFSPYVFAGLGVMTDVYTGQKMPEISFPFGIGVKVKLNDRWNLNAQWSNKLLLPIFKTNGIFHADNMENSSNYNDPNNLDGSNIFNNDLLSVVTIGISFNFWEKRCNCRNTNY